MYSQEFCADEKALEIHNDFMKAVDAVHIKYCPEKVLDQSVKSWNAAWLSTRIEQS